jgi:hypothetical protein
MTSFSRRVLGVMRLDAATFEEIEADTSALPQAVLVVIASSVSAGIGLAPSLTPRTILLTVVWSLVGWLAWASLVNYLGGGLFPDDPTRVDLGQLARTIGFSAAPGVFLWSVALPWRRTWVFAVITTWMLASMVVAVRQALDFRSVWRALAVCLGGAVLALMAALAIGVLWGPRVS